jgi:hypothetical protein
LVQKYSQTIDRESAYEILNKKVDEAAVKAKVEAEVKKEGEMSAYAKASADNRRGVESEMQQQQPKYKSATPYGSRSKTPQDQMVKVLTSATFIRGVFGILKKVMK